MKKRVIYMRSIYEGIIYEYICEKSKKKKVIKKRVS